MTRTRTKTHRLNPLPLVIAVALSACTVGPDFTRPSAPMTDAASPYTADPITLDAGASSHQQLIIGADLKSDWWRLFQSPELDHLVSLALEANPNLKAAQAALQVAHENTLAQFGAYYPSISASFAAAKQQTASQLSPTPNSGAYVFNLYTPQLAVSYVPDVFGLNARSVESLQAQEAQTKFALIATNISLTANVVVAAIQTASLRDQIAATQHIIRIDQELLRLTRNQRANGTATGLDVAAQEAQLAQIQGTLPPLQNQLAQQKDLLAILVGHLPSEPVIEHFRLANLHLPESLPLSIPSKLVEQRPDIRQAEENLHAASAQIGVAVANRLPNIAITGNVGSMALVVGQIFSQGIWSIAGGITQPLFAGGTLLHRERAARAAYTQAAEQYRSTVLAAFLNVANTLHALQQDAYTLQANQQTIRAAAKTLELTRRQQQQGTANYLSLLNAEQSYQQALTTEIQTRANQYADTAALFLAMGGGWWNNPNNVKTK